MDPNSVVSVVPRPHQQQHHRVTVMVLGCTVLPDGSPSDWLSDRLNATLRLLTSFCMPNGAVAAAVLKEKTKCGEPVEDSRAATLTVVHVLCSGAAVRGPPVTEASCMRQWLQQRLLDTLKFRCATKDVVVHCPQATTTASCEEHRKAQGKQVSLRSDRHPHVEILIEEEDAARDTQENIMYCVRCLEKVVAVASHSYTATTAQKATAGAADAHRWIAGVGDLWLITSDFHMRRAATLLHNELMGRRLCRCVVFDVVEEEEAAMGVGSPASATTDSSAVPTTTATADLAPSGQQQGRQTTIRCIAAATPTLSGDLLVARTARERMLTRSDTNAQLQRLSTCEAWLTAEVGGAAPAPVKPRPVLGDGDLNAMGTVVGPVVFRNTLQKRCCAAEVACSQ